MSDDAPQLNAANIDNGLTRLNWSELTDKPHQQGMTLL